MAGTYTSITMVAPDEAAAGSNVPVDITVKNISSMWYLFVMAALWVDGEYISLGALGTGLTLNPGETASVSVSFIMPSKDVVLTGETIVELDEDYTIIDDTVTKQVALSVAPPPPPPPPPAEPQFRGFAVKEYTRV